MAVHFACTCGKRFTAGDADVGKRARCPACGAALVVPAPATVAGEAPTSAQALALPTPPDDPAPPPVNPPASAVEPRIDVVGAGLKISLFLAFAAACFELSRRTLVSNGFWSASIALFATFGLLGIVLKTGRFWLLDRRLHRLRTELSQSDATLQWLEKYPLPKFREKATDVVALELTALLLLLILLSFFVLPWTPTTVWGQIGRALVCIVAPILTTVFLAQALAKFIWTRTARGLEVIRTFPEPSWQAAATLWDDRCRSENEKFLAAQAEKQAARERRRQERQAQIDERKELCRRGKHEWIEVPRLFGDDSDRRCIWCRVYESECKKAEEAERRRRADEERQAAEAREQTRRAIDAAAWAGDVAALEALLERGVSVDTRTDYQNYSILHAAVKEGHRAAAQLLLSRGASHAAVNAHGWTPLHTAAMDGRSEIVQLLLDAGAPVDAENHDGKSPLELAALAGHTTVIDLISSRLSPEPHPLSQPRILRAAVEGGHASIVERALAAGARPDVPNVRGWTPLHEAAFRGRRDLLERFLDAVPAPAVDGPAGASPPPLFVASENGHVDVVRLLLERGADVGLADATGRTPLDAAALANHVAIVKLLLAAGADPNRRAADGVSPTERAGRESRRVLVQAGGTLSARAKKAIGKQAMASPQTAEPSQPELEPHHGGPSRSDRQCVEKLTQLARYYAGGGRSADNRALVEEVLQIGRELDRRGGLAEMRRIFNMVPDMTGKRTVEMQWHGIGDWRG